jgi:hypothetical protein
MLSIGYPRFSTTLTDVTDSGKAGLRNLELIPRGLLTPPSYPQGKMVFPWGLLKIPWGYLTRIAFSRGVSRRI